MESLIMRLSAGAINKGSGDALAGEGGGMMGPSRSHFAGQLGRTIWIPPDQMIYDSSVGTVLGGWFRYVRLRAADAANAAIGQIAFADITLTNWQKLYQVTLDEDLASSGVAGRNIAGIFINTLGYGNYWLIQIGGVVPIQFRASLSQTGAIGCGVYAAATDAAIGAIDNALADVLAPSSTPATVTDVELMQNRYLGTAIEAPTSGGLKQVALAFKDPFAG